MNRIVEFWPAMSEPLVDLKALLVEHEDCDAGTVQKLRNGLSQGGTQLRSLREAAETLQKRLDAGQGTKPKLHLKLGIAFYFLGYMDRAAEHLQHAETALGGYYLGRPLCLCRAVLWGALGGRFFSEGISTNESELSSRGAGR